MTKSDEMIVCKTTFQSANILSVEVGTNTPMGGDAGHGGKTILRLTNDGATAWTIKILEVYTGIKHEIEDPKEVTIELYGDTEAETFIQALKYAVQVLEWQRQSKIETFAQRGNYALNELREKTS